MARRPRVCLATTSRSTAAFVATALIDGGVAGVDCLLSDRHAADAVAAALRQALAAGAPPPFVQAKTLELTDEAVAAAWPRDLPLHALLLHGPAVDDSFHGRLTELDVTRWRRLEALHAAGRVGALGVANVGPTFLRDLHDTAVVKPTVLQNRCLGIVGFDYDARRECHRLGVTYQGYGLISANRHIVRHRRVRAVADDRRWSREATVLRMCLDAGIDVLTAPSDAAQLRADLAALFDLVPMTAAERHTLGPLWPPPVEETDE